MRPGNGYKVGVGVLRDIALFAQVEWDVLVLDHMLDLSLHRQDEQHDEVNQQDWPEHRDIEEREERHGETDQQSFDAGVPSRKATNIKNKRVSGTQSETNFSKESKTSTSGTISSSECACIRVLPEFEFRQTAYERTKFCITNGGGKGGPIRILHLFKRGKETDQKVEQEDTQPIGHDEKALHHVHSKSIHTDQAGKKHPT